MQPYVFRKLESVSSESLQKEPIIKKISQKDPFMLFTTTHQPRSLFTQQDLDQSYKTGYIEARSVSLKELQEEAEFQKIESLKMIADYFPQFVQQNHENCKIFYQNILQIAQKIIVKLLPQEKIENACQGILTSFKKVIEPLCQQTQLQIRLHPEMYDKVYDSIQRVFQEKGTDVPIEFLKREDLKISECQVHWPEGMLIIDQTAMENDLQQILSIDAMAKEIPAMNLEASTTKSNE